MMFFLQSYSFIIMMLTWWQKHFWLGCVTCVVCSLWCGCNSQTMWPICFVSYSHVYSMCCGRLCRFHQLIKLWRSISRKRHMPAVQQTVRSVCLFFQHLFVLLVNYYLHRSLTAECRLVSIQNGSCTFAWGISVAFLPPNALIAVLLWFVNSDY